MYVWEDEGEQLQRRLTTLFRRTLILGTPPVHNSPALPNPLRWHLTGRDEQSDDVIRTVGSNLATWVPGVGIDLYAASKAMLIGWSKGLARDLGPRDITVNVVQPGATDTDMNPVDGPYAGSQLSHIAIQRWSQPAEVAALVAFVAGPEAARITGTGLTIDGGSNS